MQREAPHEVVKAGDEGLCVRVCVWLCISELVENTESRHKVSFRSVTIGLSYLDLVASHPGKINAAEEPYNAWHTVFNS